MFRSFAETSPAVLRIGIGLAAVAATAGPLLFAFGVLGRVAMFALGGINAGLALLLAPIGLAAKGVATLSIGLVAVAARVRLATLGLAMLGSVGGTGAILAALGGGLLSLGRSILMFPVVALRAIGVAMWGLVANPVGIAITAVVAALAALGVWVFNNWEGIKSFFAGFGSGFMEGLGPAAEIIGKVTAGLGSAFDWLGRLLGPISSTNKQWSGWGATLGGIVASGVSAVINGISRLIGFFDTVIGKAIEFGSALRGIWSGGGANLGLAPSLSDGPGLAGTRAFGGPVSFGKPYLVGERGPELFIPGSSGRIEPNNRLRSLTVDGMAAVAGSSSDTRTFGPVTFSPTFNISGENAREVAGQVRSEMHRYLAELQAEQRGLLSD